MKTKSSFENGNGTRIRKRVIAAAAALLLPLAAFASGVVSNCTEADLRAAMAGGGNVKFACDGTITLSNTLAINADTVLDGTGREMTISGGNTVRVYEVETNVSLTLVNLIIADGMSTNDGGGIYSSGNLHITNCTFLNCQAAPGGPTLYTGSYHLGGAIYNMGVLNGSGCRFMQNRALGGGGPAGGSGSTWTTPGPGAPGGSGCGGAIYNAGAVMLERALFTGNSASGGMGGWGGNGTVVYASNSAPQWGGRGGNGGNGEGAAFFNSGQAVLLNCTFSGNASAGGTGGSGGDGGRIDVQGHHDSFSGGNGGNGGFGLGTIRDAAGSVSLTNCTLAVNSGVPGVCGIGGSPGGSFGTNGDAWSGFDGSGSTLLNTLVAANSPGGNCHGTLVDLGHNLSSDATCAFSGPGSLNKVDPKLGPLANNGGPTFTMALLPGSPAIDAGDTAAAPSIDQRGFPRPAGFAADIGAYEYGSPALLLFSPAPQGGVDIVFYGVNLPCCRLQGSTNLVDWVDAATNQPVTSGTVLYHDNCEGSGWRFYRAIMP